MNRKLAFLLFPVLLSTCPLLAEEQNRGQQGHAVEAQEPKVAPEPAHEQAAPIKSKPVVIDITKPSSGTHNRNFENAPLQQMFSHTPSYGRRHEVQTSAPAQVVQPGAVVPAQKGNVQVKPEQPNTVQQNNVIRAAQQHRAKQNGTQLTLKTAGITAEPAFITDRAEMVDTDRDHSKIAYPKNGPDQGPLTAAAIPSAHASNALVKKQMMDIADPAFIDTLKQNIPTESEKNHYYWHSGKGFNYVHYTDDYGYHWYGWYVGQQYFWTRRYKGRWWLYDPNANRWNFWNDGYWWWQDPSHVGELYAYNDGNYIPTDGDDSDDNGVSVAAPQPNADTTMYPSPDSSRIVKVMGDTQDAFLYDTANPPRFAPMYLASKVQNVQFSEVGAGSPVQIILTLSDGSFDMFDADGNNYALPAAPVPAGNPNQP